MGVFSRCLFCVAASACICAFYLICSVALISEKGQAERCAIYQIESKKLCSRCNLINIKLDCVGVVCRWNFLERTERHWQLIKKVVCCRSVDCFKNMVVVVVVVVAAVVGCGFSE